MTAIADALAATATLETEYRPTVRVDHTGGHIDSEPRPAGTEPSHLDELLDKHGLDGVRIDPDRPTRVSRWQSFSGEWLEADRFYVIPDTGGATVDDYLAALEQKPPRADLETTGAAVFNFQASDLQIGKVDNGGTDGILGRWNLALERARIEHTHAAERYGAGIVHIMFPGDCLEGNQSQSGRNMWRTDLTITEQRRVFENLLYQAVEAFADQAAEVHVSAVNGNHDEAQRFQTTRPGDGWATSAADSLRNGLARNPDAYGHVHIHTPPPEQGHMTIQVGSTVYTIVHGHQWRRGKAMDWWAGQSFHGQNPAAAHLLVHGHYHTFEWETTRERIRVASPTFDGGSNYYRELCGAESRRGGLVYTTVGRAAYGITLV